MTPKLSVLPTVQNWLIPDEIDVNHSLIESICKDLMEQHISLGVAAASYDTNAENKQRIHKAMDAIANLYADFQLIIEDKANYMTEHFNETGETAC